MLQTLALFAAMSFGPAQSGLALSNERVTFGGQFGPTRPEGKFLPGDIFFLAFDIDGLKADSQGRVEYTIGMVVTDSQGKVIFEDKPSDQAMLLPLGASKLPARAFLAIGLDLRGSYTCKVTVTDKATNVGKSLTKNFEVAPPTFGIVCFHTSYDPEDKIPAPMMGVAGQALYMHFVTVNFARSQSTKQPHNQIELRVLDSNGKPTNDQPLVYEVKKDIKEDVDAIDWDLALPLNRPGTYTVELKADDKISGKSYKMTFPVTVMQSIK